MLTSVKATGQPVAGLLWYQGESDANPTDAAVYTPRMKKLVATTRRDFALPRLPWFVVQIGKHITDQVNPRSWNDIQDQQRLLPGKIAHLETVAAIDLSMDDFIHIGSAGYPLLATRLASAADRLVYGNKRETPGPQLRKVRHFTPSARPVLELEFDCAPGGLRAVSEPAGFRFVADTGAPVDMIFKTELRANVARLHLTRSALGHNLYYGHGFAPYCNITDARGFSLPALGPIRVGHGKPRINLPYLTRWKLTGIIPPAKALNKVSIAEVKELSFTAKTYPEQGFINEHEAWAARSGQAFFHTRFELSEAMELEFLAGYDGPFRIWLNEQPFLIDMKGTNPRPRRLEWEEGEARARHARRARRHGPEQGSGVGIFPAPGAARPDAGTDRDGELYEAGLFVANQSLPGEISTASRRRLRLGVQHQRLEFRGE